MPIVFIEISLSEIQYQPLIFSIRQSVATLDLSGSSFLDFLYDLQSQTPNVMIDGEGRQTVQDLSIFEISDHETLFGEGSKKREARRVWFRDRLLKPIPVGAVVNYTPTGLERVRAAANVIGTAMPHLSRTWPRLARIDPANDNFIGLAADNDNALPS